jgi:hypothetical protein
VALAPIALSAASSFRVSARRAVLAPLALARVSARCAAVLAPIARSVAASRS